MSSGKGWKSVLPIDVRHMLVQVGLVYMMLLLEEGSSLISLDVMYCQLGYRTLIFNIRYNSMDSVQKYSLSGITFNIYVFVN